jgi:hypothetical protein
MNTLWCPFWAAWILGGSMVAPQRAGEFERPLVHEVWPRECDRTWNLREGVGLNCEAA